MHSFLVFFVVASANPDTDVAIAWSSPWLGIAAPRGANQLGAGISGAVGSDELGVGAMGSVGYLRTLGAVMDLGAEVHAGGGWLYPARPDVAAGGSVVARLRYLQLGNVLLGQRISIGGSYVRRNAYDDLGAGRWHMSELAVADLRIDPSLAWRGARVGLDVAVPMGVKIASGSPGSPLWMLGAALGFNVRLTEVLALHAGVEGGVKSPRSVWLGGSLALSGGF